MAKRLADSYQKGWPEGLMNHPFSDLIPVYSWESILRSVPYNGQLVLS
jgi:hypothetical protein